MAPKDAMAAGVHDGDIVSVKADNERGTVFNHVQIRVDDSLRLRCILIPMKQMLQK